MDLQQLFPCWFYWVAVYAFICFMVFSHLGHACFSKFHSAHIPLPGPRPLPLLGNLHQLLTALPHQALAKLAKRHGPLMSLKMGSRNALFISRGCMAEEFFRANDRHFASRPHFTFFDHLLYGQHNGVAFSIYGMHWRKMRRICTLELFTPRRIQGFQKVLESELNVIVSDLNLLCQQHNGAVELDIAQLARLIVSNVMGRLVLSKRMCDVSVTGESLLEMFQKTNVAIVPAVGDFIPLLGHLLDLKSRHRMNIVHQHIDKFWNVLLEERRRDREAHPLCAPMDFLDVLLTNEEVSQLGEDNIKATLMDILGAGSETSSIAIEWAMAELLRNPQSFNKLQTELDAACGIVSALPSALLKPAPSASPPSLPWQMVLTPTSSLPSSWLKSRPLMTFKFQEPSLSLSTATTLSSSCTMVACPQMGETSYLKAVVKEALRLHPPVPLLIPRESICECKYAGYTHAANTMLFVNAWAIGRDENDWEDPEQFRPERFVDGRDVGDKVEGMENYNMLPFGTGRRRCPGMGLALSIMELTIATLVWAFDWELPVGQLATSLDMSEKSGSAGTHKAQPLVAVLRPR